MPTPNTESLMSAWDGGWHRRAVRQPSPNFGPRPAGAVLDLLVLHSISLPPGVFGGGHIAELFTNALDWSAHPDFEGLRGLQVSAHFVVLRDGRTQQFVSTDRRAWHAGVSSWQGRPNCNDYSVGIELEGLEGGHFEPAQYAALLPLLQALARRHPLQAITGHEHVAPGRKHDPGPGFDWQALQAMPGYPQALPLRC